jgi:hypothetical protein
VVTTPVGRRAVFGGDPGGGKLDAFDRELAVG